MWKLGTRPRSFIYGNICFEFSIQYICSELYLHEPDFVAILSGIRELSYFPLAGMLRASTESFSDIVVKITKKQEI